MKSHPKNPQTNLFSIQLETICDARQPLFQLANRVDWRAFESAFGPLYCPDNGRPAKPIRLMVGLHYLKAMFGESDESVVEKWVQNPYWQYFCGETEFQHRFPIDPSVMTDWRKRVGSVGLEKLLQETIATGFDVGVLKRHHIAKVNVDTTVQEKAVAFPLDTRLYHKMREKLVGEASRLGVELRQTYTRKSKSALFKQSRYRHARQMRRANRELRRVKTYFGRVLRDLDRNTVNTREERTAKLLELGYTLFSQKRDDKNKIYSLHAPEVECIAKGKAHKKYEFGCKVSVVTSSKGNFVLASNALHGNPFDGHTLTEALATAQKNCKSRGHIAEAFTDLGYRGHGVKSVKVWLVDRASRHMKTSLRRWFKRRAAIEPVIGHMKNDGGISRNHLLGVEGDRMNALMLGFGFNMRKCLKALALFWFKFLEAITATSRWQSALNF